MNKVDQTTPKEPPRFKMSKIFKNLARRLRLLVKCSTPLIFFLLEYYACISYVRANNTSKFAILLEYESLHQFFVCFSLRVQSYFPLTNGISLLYGFSYSKRIANLGAFGWNISSSINLLFLKSVQIDILYANSFLYEIDQS